MEHAESVESMAVERYLLGEMPDEERDAFEEHYFACVECGDDVYAGTALVAAVRVRERHPKPQPQPQPRWQPQPRPWLARMAIAAAAAFAIFAGYQGGVIIPQLRQQITVIQKELGGGGLGRVVRGYPMSMADSRGGPDSQVIRSDQPFELDVEISPEQGATGYVLEIVDARGMTRAHVHVTADEANDSIHLQPPGSKLPPGRYSLKVSPETAGRPSSRSFEVQ